MDIQRLIENIKKTIAKIQYYGLAYIPQYIVYRMGFINLIPALEKKEQSTVNYENMNYLEDMAKWFKANTGENLELENPKTFNQKIQWLKIYDTNPKKTLLADKYLVREWVKEKIGEKYLIPLIGVWDSADEIDFSALPKKFALKCNHGSHWNIIVDNKENLNLNDVRSKLNRWMSMNFAYLKGYEIQYRDIPRKIIAEEYMENFNGQMYDYKFYCFSGKVYYIQFLEDRNGGLKMAYFDRNWVKQEFANNHPCIQENIPKPSNLTEMIRIAEVLSDGFQFVRVDLYRLNDGKIIFGEMTFSPGSGTQDWRPSITNYKLGALINLPDKTFTN